MEKKYMEWIMALTGLLVSWIVTAQTNNANKSMIDETNAKNEELMREGWERDDYALDRKVEALKRNGMSPLLAVNGGTSTSTPIQVQAHKQSNDIGSVLGNAMDLFSSGQMYKQQKLDNEAKKLDNDYKQKTIEYLQKQIDHYGESPELKNIEYVFGKLEEYWPDIKSTIGSWLGIKNPDDMSFEEIFTSPEERSKEISGMQKLTEESGIVSMAQQQTIEGLIRGFVKANGKVPNQVLSRFVDPIAETFNVDVVDLINLYYDMLDE